MKCLRRHGKSEEEAYRIVSEEMRQSLDPSGMQNLARKSFFLPLMKKIVPFGFKHGSGYMCAAGSESCDYWYVGDESQTAIAYADVKMV